MAIAACAADITFAVADIQEDTTGKNFLKDSVFQGNEAAYLGVELGVGFLAPGPGGEVRAGAKIATNLAEHTDDLADGIRAAEKVVAHADEAADLGKSATKTIDNASTIAKDSKGNQLLLAAPEKQFQLPAPTNNAIPKTDFYVKPNGDTIPATGYRYMDSSLEDAARKGTVPGSYIGFEKFDSSQAAANAYQVSPNWSDMGIRGEFDTLQIADDIYVPRSFGDTGNTLEPFTNSYPQYGLGGHYQLKTNSSIELSNVYKMGE
jgi:hypothetical protein